MSGSVDCVLALISAMADVNVDGLNELGCSLADRVTAMTVAADRGNVEIVHALIKSSANLEKTWCSNRDTALIYAAKNGFVEVTRALITAKANVDFSGFCDRTALICASSKGHGEVVEMLIASQSDVNTSDSCSRSALSYAAEKGNIGIAQQLLHANATITCARKDRDHENGRTVLMFGCISGNVEMVST